MKKEKSRHRYSLIPGHELKRIIIRSLVLTAITFPTILALANYKTDSIVADALWGNASTEKPMLLSENNIPHAGVIAVLGGGLDDNLEPNRFQKRRERAAAIGVVEFDMSDQVLLLDGYEPSGANPNATENYFLQEAKLLSHGQIFPKDAITVDSESTSTATNLDALKAFMEENHLENAIVVTDEFHRVRTEALIKIKKINAVVVTVEQLTRLHNPHELIGILRQNAQKNDEWHKREKLKLFTMFFDPQGEITAEIERLFLRFNK